MQTISVDGEAQAAWQARVAAAHARVKLTLVDAAGNEHALIDLAPDQTACSTYPGSLEDCALKLELPSERRQTSWRMDLCPTEALHVRVDDRGQLEVWSGSMPVAKVFGIDATPEDFPYGLIHCEAGKFGICRCY